MLAAQVAQESGDDEQSTADGDREQDYRHRQDPLQRGHGASLPAGPASAIACIASAMRHVVRESSGVAAVTGPPRGVTRDDHDLSRRFGAGCRSVPLSLIDTSLCGLLTLRSVLRGVLSWPDSAD